MEILVVAGNLVMGKSSEQYIDAPASNGDQAMLAIVKTGWVDLIHIYHQHF